MQITRRVRRLFSPLRSKSWQQLLLALVLYILPVAAFVAMVDGVRERETLSQDIALLQYIHSFATPQLYQTYIALTNLGGIWWVAGLTMLAGGLLVWKRRPYPAAIVMVSVGGAELINLVIKALFERDRPQLWQRLVVENSYSFPSGHAMASAALALSLIVVLWSTRWRYLTLTIGLVYMVAIGLSRLYLGVHYPTDILAGWLAGAVWVAIVARLVNSWWSKS